MLKKREKKKQTQKTNTQKNTKKNKKNKKRIKIIKKNPLKKNQQKPTETNNRFNKDSAYFKIRICNITIKKNLNWGNYEKWQQHPHQQKE